MGREKKERAEKAKTMYVVLRRRTFKEYEVAGDVEASGASSARRHFADKDVADGGPGLATAYVAVPEVSFQHESFETERTVKLKSVPVPAEPTPETPEA